MDLFGQIGAAPGDAPKAVPAVLPVRYYPKDERNAFRDGGDFRQYVRQQFPEAPP